MATPDKKRRRGDAPRASFEELEIRTADGAALRATLEEASGSLRATVVLTHSLFARRTSFGGTAKALSLLGYRVISLDFRAHGKSTAPTTGYDRLVESDLPTVVQCARDRADGAPVFVVGHSLGAHTAAVSQGLGLLGADGIVALGGAPWVEASEPSRLRWSIKRGVMRTMFEIARRTGRYPARAMRIGSDDETLDMMEDLHRFTSDGWQSRRGVDYLASLTNVKIPLISIAGTRDPISSATCVKTLFTRCPNARFELVEGATHMSLAKHVPSITAALDSLF